MPTVKKGGMERWARRSAAASQDYKEGVANSGGAWEANTLAAEQAHKLGTEAALREGRFAKGVKKSGQQWWKSQSETLGPQRFAEGVAAGMGTYEEGVAPYLAVIEQTKLSPRGPKGDPRNYARVQEMGQALRNKKTGGAK